jgi:hypothetical protein
MTAGVAEETWWLNRGFIAAKRIDQTICGPTPRWSPRVENKVPSKTVAAAALSSTVHRLGERS